MFSNCKNESIEYESFTSDGETINSSYAFCSYTLMEIEYTYRTGKWTFNSSHGYKIAEGEYENPRQTIDTLGGCPFSYIDTVINLEKWMFWNEKGDLIEPNQKMINLIQPNQFKSDNPFE